MAKAQSVSPAMVQRSWNVQGLEPHRTRSFKLSGDKQFVEKLTDVVGLYLNPPDKALEPHTAEFALFFAICLAFC